MLLWSDAHLRNSVAAIQHPLQLKSPCDNNTLFCMLVTVLVMFCNDLFCAIAVLQQTECALAVSHQLQLLSVSANETVAAAHQLYCWYFQLTEVLGAYELT